MIKAVGIDLGSTFSVISYVKNDGNIEVIPNAEGNRITPSVFAIDDNSQIMVGDLATEFELSCPQNTVRLVKRRMSRGFEKSYSFGNSITMSPVDISAEIIKKLKRDAEDYLGESITDAVITVPAYFNNSEREATKAAGELAGLKVLRIINEPTAASLAYGLDKNNDSTILVYDLGGGTFDVTLLNLSDGCDFHVLSTAGDTQLGGSDFDHLLGYFILEKLDFNSSYDVADLRYVSEKTKKSLSQLNVANVRFQGLQTTVTRSEFESIIDPLILKTKTCIDLALSDAKLKYNNIDEIVFVGGSTRIPFVSKKVEEWTGKKPNKSINPDEAVSIGAAIQASVLSGNSKKDVFLVDVIPLSLGIETQGGVMNTMIRRNTQIPSEYTETFTTAEDNQTSVDVKVFQGERPQTKNNHFLGEFKLNNIPPMRRATPKIDVIFEVDADGIVTVKAKDEASGNQKNMVLSESISQEQMVKMLKDAEENKVSDERFKQIANLRDWLGSLRIQLFELIDTKVLNDNEIKELEDLRISIDSDYLSENVELLSALVESGKDLIDELSKKVHEEAKKAIK
jgi:molecular chaperone DnaK